MQQDAPIFSKPAGQKDHGSPGRPRHPLSHAAGRTGQQKQGQCGEQQHPPKAAVRPAGKRLPFFASHPAAPFLLCWAILCAAGTDCATGPAVVQ